MSDYSFAARKHQMQRHLAKEKGVKMENDKRPLSQVSFDGHDYVLKEHYIKLLEANEAAVQREHDLLKKEKNEYRIYFSEQLSQALEREQKLIEFLNTLYKSTQWSSIEEAITANKLARGIE